MIPNKIKREIFKLIPRLVKTTVAAIVIKDNKILLEKRSHFLETNKWCLPGGHMEYGETAVFALKREIKEELNLEVTSSKFLGYFDEFIPRIKSHSVVLVFKVNVKGAIKPDSKEVSQAKWFSKKELKTLNFAYKHKELVNKFWKKKK